MVVVTMTVVVAVQGSCFGSLRKEDMAVRPAVGVVMDVPPVPMPCRRGRAGHETNGSESSRTRPQGRL